VAGLAEPCIFCEKIHRGACKPDEPLFKAAPKKRAPKKQPAPSVSTPAPSPFAASSQPAVDEVAVALGALARAGMLHEDEYSKHGLTRPERPMIAQRIRSWRGDR
jgi:hypothetical protein